MTADPQVIIQKYMQALADLQARVFYLEAILANVEGPAASAEDQDHST